MITKTANKIIKGKYHHITMGKLRNFVKTRRNVTVAYRGVGWGGVQTPSPNSEVLTKSNRIAN